MRVISGEFGSRRLKAVPNTKTRPTTDKIKEAMFNLLMPYLPQGNVLDLYSGSGGLGIEAISRGNQHAWLVDRQRVAVDIIKENVAITRAEDQFTILKMDANKALEKFAHENIKFDLVLLDPPYKEQQIVNLLDEFVKLDLLNDRAIIVAETDTSVEYPEIKHYRLLKQQTYGITEVVLFEFEKK